MKTIKEIQKEVYALAVEKGWWDCATCEGTGFLEIVGTHHLRPNQTGPPYHCPTCNGLGEHRNTGEAIALMHAELSKALEALRNPELLTVCDKCNDAGGWDDSRFDREEDPLNVTRRDCKKCEGTGKALGGSRLAEEFADVIIRICDTAEFLGLDLESAVQEKHAYNATRPKKHSGGTMTDEERKR